MYRIYSTVGENNIGTTKIRNNYGAIQLFIFQYCDSILSNIGLFPITPCKVIALNLFFFIYGISSLLLFLIALSKVIALPIKSKSKS